MKDFTVQFEDPETEENHSVSGTFQENEWKTLLRFYEYAEELNRTSFIRERANVRVKVHWDFETGMMTDKSTVPPRPQIVELLHGLRPFLLQSEATHFYRVVNILKRRFAHPYTRAMLDRVKDHYTSDPDRMGWTFSVGDLPLNSEEALDKWLNAYEYHRDEAKRAELEAIFQGELAPYSVAMFLTRLTTKVAAIFAVARIIRAANRGTGAQVRITFTSKPTSSDDE